MNMKNRLNVFAYGLMLCLTAGLIESSALAESRVTMRIVQGEVVATNLKDDPPAIVVKVTMPNREELIVGATVPPGTHVSRGKRAVALAEIHVGEKVVLGYLKQPDGLTARSIHVQ
ncbi:MAG: hypothetical protein Q7U39_00890 [Nitrospira sp.]|nr:hypothetical protein [Nitrospira sp.]